MEKHPIYPHIFRPLKIGQTEVRNRIFVPAHTTNFGENNLPSDRHLAYHRARAAGGAGLIIFEGIRVHKSSLGRQQGVNGYEAKAIPKFREIAKAVQGEGDASSARSYIWVAILTGILLEWQLGLPLPFHGPPPHRPRIP